MSANKSLHSPSRVSFPLSERRAHPGSTITNKTDSRRLLSVSVIVKRKNPLDLHELAGRQISQTEFSEKYAADPANFDHLRDFAHKSGLTVEEGASSLARRTIVLRGPTSDIEAAFGVELYDYTHKGKQFHSYTGTISMAQEHAEPVEAVFGLDSHPLAQPHFRIFDQTIGHKRTGVTSSPAPSFNAPQVAELYNFPTGINGAGQTIGILELGGGYRAHDFSTYFSRLGIPEPKITAISVDGGANSPGDPDGADGEVALDVEVAGSIAPGANLAIYFTPNTSQGFIDALTTAIHDTRNGPPSVISISWGESESGWTAQSMAAFDEAAQSAAALGITILVASGDSGSSDGNSGENVNFPASSPHVLACGGTELIAAGQSIEREVVWNDQPQGGASGGGFSRVFERPTWQNDPQIVAKGRGVPDVAGDASPGTGYNIYFDGRPQVVGGTSAVAPLWAALIALINQQRGSSVGFVNPTLYKGAQNGFHDILEGDNGSFSAKSGWDACTGLGSPNGRTLPSLFPSASRNVEQAALAPASIRYREHAEAGD